MQIDTTKPNISRIYDYVLGGRHNFEVDRVAAEQILKVFPSYPRWARLNRWFLQMVAAQWGESGHRYILDFGSGLPTQGHFHTSAPQAKVIYTDSDAMTVAYARDVLGDNPSVLYLHNDVRDFEGILVEADRFFGGERCLAIGCIGLAYFVDDNNLTQMIRALHDWAAPGSIMALSFIYGDINAESYQRTKASFQRSGSELYPRRPEEIERLLTPWVTREIKPLATWLGAESLVEESDRENAGYDMYGVVVDHTR